MSRFPKQRDELAESFSKLNSLGFIREYDQLTKEERETVDRQGHRYVLPVSIAYKPDSASTTVHICMDASARAGGKFH